MRIDAELGDFGGAFQIWAECGRRESPRSGGRPPRPADLDDIVLDDQTDEGDPTD